VQKLCKLLTGRKARGIVESLKRASHLITQVFLAALNYIDKRKALEHIEGDLVMFESLKSLNFTTLVEHKSRLVKLIYKRSKYTSQVIGGIKNILQTLPKNIVKPLPLT
jgi:IS30 family transposase